MKRKRTLLALVPALVLGAFLTLVAFPSEALAASYNWTLETEFKTSFTTGHSQNRLTENGNQRVLWTFGTQVEIGKPTLQEAAATYTLATLQTNGLPFKVTVNGQTQEPSNYMGISRVTATWEQNMRARGGATDARTGIIVRAYGAGGNVVATYYDNFTGSTQRPTWGVGYKNKQTHSFSLDLISNGNGKAGVYYQDGTKYNGEWTNQNLVMRTEGMAGTNLVRLLSTNTFAMYDTWAYGSTVGQDITRETRNDGDVYSVKIQNPTNGNWTDRLGTTNVRIDKTNPTPSAVFDSGTGTFRNTSSDEKSGVKLTEVKIEGPQNFGWTNIDNVTVTTPGKYNVVIRTTDNAGNVAESSMGIEVSVKPITPEPEPEPEPEVNPDSNLDMGNTGDGYGFSVSN